MVDDGARKVPNATVTTEVANGVAVTGALGNFAFTTVLNHWSDLTELLKNQ